MSDLICSVDACNRIVTRAPGKGLCWAHYQRLRKTGTTDARVRQGDLECQIDGCTRPRNSGGLCRPHADRLVRNTIRADKPVRLRLVPAVERFWPLVTKTETCWLFANVQDNGYGYFNANSRPVQAHRFSYEHFVGPIPDGLHIDHLCKVRNCVNPAHLEAVTPWENTMRSDSVSAINARKTECLRGHPFSDDNTYYCKQGKRHCRECARIRAGKYADKRRKIGTG